MIDLEKWEDELAEIVLKWQIEVSAAREIRALLFRAIRENVKELGQRISLIQGAVRG